jgi:hypothetical protein
MDAQTRDKVVSAFGAHLEAKKLQFARESDLPFPKEVIRQALAEAIVYETNPRLVEAIESCFLFLEDFVSDEEFIVVQRYEHLLAQRHQLLKAEGAEVRAIAKEMADALSSMTEILDRTLALKKTRMQQLTKLRALR